MLVAAVAEDAIAVDLVAETTHRLNRSAATLLEACDGESDRDLLVRRWASEERTDLAEVDRAVGAALERFATLGLVGRESIPCVPDPPAGSRQPENRGAGIGSTHSVIDHRIAFRSPQSWLLSAIDRLLIAGQQDVSPTLVFDVAADPSGKIHLVTDEVWEFPDLDLFLGQLVSILNEYAGWTHTCPVIHAGAVRAPNGGIILLAGPAGCGKSTLTGAFVREGWDYLGDEAIGVRPGSLVAVGYPKRLVVDARSRRVLGLDQYEDPCGDPAESATGLQDSGVQPADLRRGVNLLGGDVGPVGQIILPSFLPGAEPGLDWLPPGQGAIRLLANTLNLARSGQTGVETVCELAASVPVRTLTFGDAPSAVSYCNAAISPANRPAAPGGSAP